MTLHDSRTPETPGRPKPKSTIGRQLVLALASLAFGFGTGFVALIVPGLIYPVIPIPPVTSITLSLTLIVVPFLLMVTLGVLVVGIACRAVGLSGRLYYVLYICAAVISILMVLLGTVSSIGD
jgi:hypothetical protein